MEYCHSGKESLWCGSWNRHLCRKGKCAADRHSRSTGVNPSRKQRCYSPSCLWSQAQRDTSDPDATFFFPVESKYCMNSASYEYRNMLARRGAQFVPIGMPTICWKTFLPKFSWRRESSVTTSGLLKIDSCLEVTECLSRRILRFSTSLIDLIYSERMSSSTSSLFVHRLAYSSHVSLMISNFLSHKNETGSLNFGPLFKRSPSFSFRTILIHLYHLSQKKTIQRLNHKILR